MTRLRVRTRVLTLLLLSGAASPLAAQRATAARTAAAGDSVDRIIRAEMMRGHIPGVALAVVRGGRTIKLASYGVADLEHGVPVTPKTAFKIGSLSKQFLASGIMLLQQDGKLRIDDSVAKYISGTPVAWRPVTLRHLLSHTSGIQREGPAFDPLKVQADSVVIASAFAAPLLFPTGSKHEYCNVCYFTLAEIIARVSGKPWDVFFAERVFTPLGMTATRATTVRELVPHRARGYSWSKDRIINADEYLALRPSGAFISTLEDMVKWNAALDAGRMLSATSLSAMWTPAALTNGSNAAYGFGWRLDSLDGRWRVHHGGSLPGFRAEWARFPAESLSIILLTNADGVVSVQNIVENVARAYLPVAGGGR
ncbi:MAG: serine hydrolase domain-containing protein [Gemmatimonadaceae bacterium]